MAYGEAFVPTGAELDRAKDRPRVSDDCVLDAEERLRTFHFQNGEGFCPECDQSWPCYVIETLDAVREQLRATQTERDECRAGTSHHYMRTKLAAAEGRVEALTQALDALVDEIEVARALGVSNPVYGGEQATRAVLSANEPAEPSELNATFSLDAHQPAPGYGRSEWSEAMGRAFLVPEPTNGRAVARQVGWVHPETRGYLDGPGEPPQPLVPWLPVFVLLDEWWWCPRCEIAFTDETLLQQVQPDGHLACPCCEHDDLVTRPT